MYKYISLFVLVLFIGCNSKNGCQCQVPHCTCEISQQAKDMCECQDYLDKNGNKLPEIPQDGSRPNHTMENNNY